MIFPQAPPVPDAIRGTGASDLLTPDRDRVPLRLIPPQWSVGRTLRAYQEYTMPDRPTFAHGHLPPPGLLLRSDAAAKRGLWYVLAVATMELEAASAASDHTTSRPYTSERVTRGKVERSA